jgi:hypothetical protein
MPMILVTVAAGGAQADHCYPGGNHQDYARRHEADAHRSQLGGSPVAAFTGGWRDAWARKQILAQNVTPLLRVES